MQIPHALEQLSTEPRCWSPLCPGACALQLGKTTLAETCCTAAGEGPQFTATRERACTQQWRPSTVRKKQNLKRRKEERKRKKRKERRKGEGREERKKEKKRKNKATLGQLTTVLGLCISPRECAFRVLPFLICFHIPLMITQQRCLYWSEKFSL